MESVAYRGGAWALTASGKGDTVPDVNQPLNARKRPTFGPLLITLLLLAVIIGLLLVAMTL